MRRQYLSPWSVIVAAITSVFVISVVWRHTMIMIPQKQDLVSPGEPSSPPLVISNKPVENKLAEMNEKVARLERIIDSIPPNGRKPTEALSNGFQWIESAPFDAVRLTSATNESFIEKTVYTYMKQLQITCPKQIRMGRKEDGGWDVCVAGPFNIVKPCLAYSIGMGGEWSFDEMITKQYECQDWTYDPSLGKSDHKPNPLFWFFNVGLGGENTVNSMNWRLKTFPTLLEENNHIKSTIDILKMDIEGSEWESLIAILSKPQCLDNVKQLMIEYHTREIVTEHSKGGHSSLEDLLSYWQIARGIDRLGYKLWTVWNNDFCNFESTRTPGLKLCGCFNAYYVNTRLL